MRDDDAAHGDPHPSRPVETNLPESVHSSTGGTGLRVAGLFSGVGALELGLSRGGHHASSLCEIWSPARRVLQHRYPGVDLIGDVATARACGAELLAAGFPCTDLSIAGSRKGLDGPQSGLVRRVLTIVAQDRPQWVLMENVPQLLSNAGGAAIREITSTLSSCGYRWAYRVVDSTFTGVPQRRRRVILLAGHDIDPRHVLLAEDSPDRRYEGGQRDHTHRQDQGIAARERPASAFGFYWTEGRRGLGLTSNAIPTLKGGSTIGIPSQPAIWLPEASIGRRIVVPSIVDGERFQGLPAGWTTPALTERERDHRWKLIGNAVTVGVGEWIGRMLNEPGYHDEPAERALPTQSSWPAAGWGGPDGGYVSRRSAWPRRPAQQVDLVDFLDLDNATPLSARATAGFTARLEESEFAPDPHFLADLKNHRCHMATHPVLRSSTRRSIRTPLEPQARDGAAAISAEPALGNSAGPRDVAS